MIPVASSPSSSLLRASVTSAVVWGTVAWCGCVAAARSAFLVAPSVGIPMVAGFCCVWIGSTRCGRFCSVLIKGLSPVVLSLAVSWPAIVAALTYPSEETFGLAMMYLVVSLCIGVLLGIATHMLSRLLARPNSNSGDFLERVSFACALLASVVGLLGAYTTRRYSVPLAPLILSCLLCIDSVRRDWRRQRWLADVRAGRLEAWSIRPSENADALAPSLCADPLIVRDAVVMFSDASGASYRRTAGENWLSVDQFGMTERMILRRILGQCVVLAATVFLGVGMFLVKTEALVRKDPDLEDLMVQVPLRMLQVRGGTFVMGGLWAGDEKPRHGVYVKSFEIDETEVAVQDYESCVRSRGCTADMLSDPDPKRCNWGNKARHNHPINCVSWHQAEAYCRWVGKRLPSEVEWEYAARGEEPPEEFDVKGDVCALMRGQEHTCRVGRFPQRRSPFGLLDTIGNVWEWTSSRYCGYPKHECSQSTFVFRGGGWGGRGPWRATSRTHDTQSTRDFDLGFRCARDNETAPAPGAMEKLALPTPEPRDDVTGEMVSIGGGDFTMGRSDGSSDERPVHSVSIERFEMDKTEVTVAAYEACVKSGRCQARTYTLDATVSENDKDARRFAAFCNWGKRGRESFPMNCVDFINAEAFCRWAGKRLPTEEQWEYAARGTDDRIYPWGNAEPNGKLLNACGTECRKMGAEMGWTWKAMHKEFDEWPETAPVGSFPAGASAFGILDMAGNVSEWTLSAYADHYGQIGDEHRRVRRGGDWYGSSAAQVRATSRSWSAPEARSFSIGFRCSR